MTTKTDNNKAAKGEWVATRGLNYIPHGKKHEVRVETGGEAKGLTERDLASYLDRGDVVEKNQTVVEQPITPPENVLVLGGPAPDVITPAIAAAMSAEADATITPVDNVDTPTQKQEG